MGQALWSPQIDIFEPEGNLIVHADLPGLRQQDVRVSVDRGLLTISGQRRHETTNEREQGNDYYRERPWDESAFSPNSSGKVGLGAPLYLGR